MFNIIIKNQKYKKNGILCKIIINDFKEHFVLDTTDKSLNFFKKQWKAGINRLNEWYNSSILITSSWNGWCLHRDNDKVYITERIFKENLLDDPYRNLSNKEENRLLTPSEIEEAEEEWIIYWENQMLFSEWNIDFKDLLHYKENM